MRGVLYKDTQKAFFAQQSLFFPAQNASIHEKDIYPGTAVHRDLIPCF
jgi:hypothetical protein